jgi:hypothetical protein
LQLYPLEYRRKVTLLTLQYRFEVIVLSHPCIPEHRCVVLALVFDRQPVLLPQVQAVCRRHLGELDQTCNILAGHTDPELHIAEDARVVRNLPQNFVHHAPERHDFAGPAIQTSGGGPHCGRDSAHVRLQVCNIRECTGTRGSDGANVRLELGDISRCTGLQCCACTRPRLIVGRQGRERMRC